MSLSGNFSTARDEYLAKCLVLLMVMVTEIIPCGTLKVNAREMHNNLPSLRITNQYKTDQEGNMRISMNALLVDTGSRVVLFDPGCAEFLPSRFIASYGLEIGEPLEKVLDRRGYEASLVTDVVFTHLHFDHASGAFARKPGQICKRFPNAAYHVLNEHYDYARRPDKKESSSFAISLFRYLDSVSWLEDWEEDWMVLKIFNGHTRAMIVPGIHTGKGWIWYVTDLIPMQSFLESDVCSSYDLDPALALREKNEFLAGLPVESELIFFHDPLTDRMFYS